MAEPTKEPTIGLTRADLQAMLETVVKAAKEPTEIEKAKQQREHEQFLKRERENLAVAQAQVAREESKRRNCSHVHHFKGQQFHGWQGQVHNDNLVHPVCKFCGTEWPPFSATLLNDGGKSGVNMEESNASVPMLTEMHQKSFPAGCTRKSCFICYPKEARRA